MGGRGVGWGLRMETLELMAGQGESWQASVAVEMGQRAPVAVRGFVRRVSTGRCEWMRACFSQHVVLHRCTWWSWQGGSGSDIAPRLYRVGAWGDFSHCPFLPPADKATNPLNKDLDWDGINAFCEQLNKELEG